MGLRTKRRVGDKVQIGTDILVLVTGIQGKEVNLEITAPPSIVISLPPPRPPCAADMRTPIDHRD